MSQSKGIRNEIILHVGLHKTGTTSIQETLYLENNNQLLEKKGYLYPKCGPSNHSVSIYSIFCNDPTNYHINIRMGYSADEIKYVNEKYLSDLKTEIDDKKLSKLIISGEDISLLSLDNLNALKEHLTSIFSNNIKVIIYVRHPVQWVISTIQQFIKSGRQNYKDALIDMEKNIKSLFVDRIEKFTHVFGREFVNVYSFEEAVLNKFGPVGHFLSVIGMNQNELTEFNIVYANESISLIAVEIISYINEKLPLFRDGKMNELRSNGDINPFLNVKGFKFDIPYGLKEKILEKSREDIEWLKKNWGIDYSTVQIRQIDNFSPDLSEEIIEEIKQACFEVPESLRSLVVEYLQMKLMKNSVGN
ncbi:hypothetical protein BC351_31935 [Paenibacillus ferrarius]|uniref:Uncharacterized protein n=1 Tax=Paenibacillus ferrarius TaxID=1469647 RepID=A0A1V4HEX3_9BACL|nr:sulfotransferase domain-containing protein [Paenibacillus ferrarius]OPH53091.1 hypothetical protein BC351_31935 [Paenibacillus ferrarius]